MSSRVAAAGSPGPPARDAGAADGVAAGMSSARVRCHVVTPLPVSTPRPRGNASARACRAA